MTKFVIYWWAKTETRIRGHDEIELPQDELDDDEADEILQEKSMGTMSWSTNKYPSLPTFEDKYLNATFCENFGVVKVVKVAPPAQKPKPAPAPRTGEQDAP